MATQPFTRGKPDVTDGEAEIVRLLALAWNLYLDLPPEHPMDQGEFCSAIHRCQDMVLSRAGRRMLLKRERERGV